MLYIVTDLSDTRWLTYILDEFSRIERAEFSISVTSEAPPGGFVISYSEQGDIPMATHDTSGLTTNDDGLEVYGLQPENSADINYDLFWSAFVLLSRLEEYQAETRDEKKLQGYASRHPRGKDHNWKKPTVTILFKTMKAFISKRFSALTFAEEQAPELELSHDLDYIRKTLPLRLKQSAFNGYNALKNIHRPKIWWDKTRKAFKFLFGGADYWCFDYWRSFEEKMGMRSVFYVYSKNDQRGFKKWLMDPSYDVGSNKKLQAVLQDMHQNGWRIGLHGSFLSATDLDMLQDEKNRLEAALGLEVKKTRQHWLRYEESITPRLHSHLFEEDSTLGWNDQIGFRAGCASKYRPYDHENQKPFEHYIIPQVVMDSTIYDYGYGNEKAILLSCIELLKTCQSLGNSHVAISWHPRTCSKDYNWHVGYEKLVEEWRASTRTY